MSATNTILNLIYSWNRWGRLFTSKNTTDLWGVYAVSDYFRTS